MIKKLKTVNVDFLQNRTAQDIIYNHISEGWGIDAMVEDSRRNTWVTFYKYQEEKVDVSRKENRENDTFTRQNNTCLNT